jgi:hypothetical protein
MKSGSPLYIYITTSIRKIIPIILFSTVLLTFPFLVTCREKEDPYPKAKGPFHTLVKNGQSLSTIVLPKNPSFLEKHAADELQKYLFKVTGIKLPIKTSKVKELKFPIYLGKAAQNHLPEFNWEELGSDGFLLMSDDKGLYIAGINDLGTVYGVYDFLEKFVGVRWFMPGELGEVVPETETLQIGTFRNLEKPDFRYRWVSDGEWALRNKMNVSVDVKGDPVGVQWKWSFHTHFRFIPPEKYYKDHPEWFALVNGIRRNPEYGKKPVKSYPSYQLCTSNPQVIKEMAKNIIKFFNENPSIDILALAPQDGGGFCECDRCTALDEHRPPDEAWHAKYSNRLAVFNNQVAKLVAKKYPDKLLKVGAYAMYLRVPNDPHYRPEPNLAIQVCHTYSCNNHPVNSERCSFNTKFFRNELEHWAKLTKHLFIYEYYNKGVWGNLPYDQIHVIREDIPYYYKIGVEGFYTQPPRDRWPSTGLNHYIASKLLWNVNLDVDSLIKDFCKKFYEEAASPMKDYYNILEKAFIQYDDHISPFGYQWTTVVAHKLYTDEVLNQLDESIERAEKMAQSVKVKKRINFIRIRLNYTQMVVDYIKAIRKPFLGINLDDEQVLMEAHQQAEKMGEPITQKIREYALKNGIQPEDRIIAAHMKLRFIISNKELPNRNPLLL